MAWRFLIESVEGVVIVGMGWGGWSDYIVKLVINRLITTSIPKKITTTKENDRKEGNTIGFKTKI